MPKPLAVVILGAGPEGTELLTTLLNVSGIEILVIADRDSSSPGFEVAEAAGVRMTSGPVRLPVLRRADVIFDAGGDSKLVGPIQRNKLLRPKLLDGPATHLALRLLTQYRQGQAQLRQTERMTVMGNLLASAAHELNNPLLVVTGYSALAGAHFQDGSLAEAREDIKRMAEAADRLRVLMERFLKFGRPASSSDVPCDVNACVRAVLRRLEPDLRRLEIRLVTSLAPALPPVFADPQAVQEVLVNLMTNAREVITASHQGSMITCETAAGLNDTTGRYVQIRIGDDGPGIPRVHLPHIFEPLYTTKSPGPNTGMGLAVCYGTVSALGGTITCDSKPEQGALFTIRLPAGEPGGTGRQGS
ncbi:MAG: ATP-binding protein [Nitrospirota bacterium]